MINVNFKKLLLFFVVLVIIIPPVALYLQHKFYPPSYLFQLTYTEMLDEATTEPGESKLIFTYCFEVPGDLEINNDLQDFFVAMTRKEIKEIVMSDVTGIDQFSYQTEKGCGDYTAMISADSVKAAYPLYRNGEL